MLDVQLEDVPSWCQCAAEIKRIIGERLDTFGYTGVWRIIPLGKTAPCKEQFECHHTVSDARGTYIEVVCRPGNVSWMVALFPPADYTIDDVVANLGGRRPRLRVKPAIGQVFQAKVINKLPYGMNVHIRELDTDGFIPLEHIAAKYDRDNLNKYSIGDTIKASIVGLAPLKLSIVGAEHTTGENITDTFSGVPDADGRLSLKGFSTGARSIDRKLDLLQWLRDDARRYYPNPIPPDVAIDTVSLGLMDKYGATDIPRQHVAKIIWGLMREKWVIYGEGVLITPQGWEELGGYESDQPISSSKPAPIPAQPESQPELEAEPESKTKIERLNTIITQIAALESERQAIERWLIESQK